jgi:hypothetical protein
MSQPRIEELKEKSRTALTRSIGQVRAAALVAALVPLASVAVAPAVAEAQGSAGFVVPSPCDLVTSGGFVIDDAGGKVTFGAHGGCKLGEFRGSLTVSDHRLDYHVDLQQMTGYVTPLYNPEDGPGVARDLCGTARTSQNEVVAFRLRLEDHDEPGISDLFGLRLSNGYHISTRLLGDGGPGGGNVQLHQPNRTNVGPAAPGSEAEMCFQLETP